MVESVQSGVSGGSYMVKEGSEVNFSFVMHSFPMDRVLMKVGGNLQVSNL